MASPPSPTFVFEIKYPDNAEGITLQFSIKLPNGMTPVIQGSTPSLEVSNQPLPESERREFILKQQLHQRKFSNADTATSSLGMPAMISITPPPTSSSQSDKCVFDSVETLVNEPSDGSRAISRHGKGMQLHTPSTSTGGSHADYRRDSPENKMESTRTFDPIDRRPQPARLVTSSSRRSTSPPQTPPGSPRRARSTSPLRKLNGAMGYEVERGRSMSPKRVDNSDALSFGSRSSSHSRRSRSRSREYRRDDRASRNLSPDRDGMLVERVSRSVSPTKDERFSSRRPEERSKYREDTSPLKNRISEQLFSQTPTKRHKHRTCPFFHPSDSQRHPLGQPHPGYTMTEFDEAVAIHENGHVLPGRLIKAGVVVNIQNKGSPIRPSTVAPWSRQSGNINPPVNRNIRGPPTSASADDRLEPPAKRRRMESHEQEEPYRRDGGMPYSSSTYARPTDSRPQYGRQGSSQYFASNSPSSERYPRPAPRLMSSELARGARQPYRRLTSDQSKY